MSRPIGVRPLPSPPVITMASRCSIGGAISRLGVGAAASGASPFSDVGNVTMMAFPLVLDVPTPVVKFFWLNGSSAGGNSEVVLYDENYSKIGTTTGSIADSGASAPQATAPTGGTFTVPPGLYYCALGHSNDTTTNRFFRWSVATLGIELWQSLGCWKQAGLTLGSLPSPATPAKPTNVAFPVFGIITRTVFDA